MLALLLFRVFILPLAILVSGGFLAGCSIISGDSMTSVPGLPPGLLAHMDQPNTTFNRAEAVALINAYRATTGVTALIHDTALDGSAQALANQYARTDLPPSRPQGLVAMKLGAGYATFAETFSGWRNNPVDVAGLRIEAGRAGIGVAFNPASHYGVYWVLVLDK